MDFNIDQKISNFIEGQFPQFYHEEGPGFILFTKAYYEWLQESNNAIGEARSVLNYRDIDSTIESFLEHFQKKYLYGIPFNVIINKRYLLKHILDVYRSKSSIQGYKLLFRLIYDEDVEIYLPGRDILKSSAGTWKEPKYLEVTYSSQLANITGQEIIGAFSGVRAVVENYNRESFDTNISNIVYISNIRPRDSSFEIGEKIVAYGQESNVEILQSAPVILGSLHSLNIINGGQDFSVGDIVKISSTDLDTNEKISHGYDGILKISRLSRGNESLTFTVSYPGFGFTTNALSLIYPIDGSGYGASFDVGSLSSVQEIEYNTDILCDYLDLTLDAAAFGFPLDGAANLSSTILSSLSYESNIFGGINTLTNIRTGTEYTSAANVFVRSTINSNVLSGNVSYDTTSNTITGVSTSFTDVFVNNSIICLQANSSNTDTEEYMVIREVVNTTSLTLYGPPQNNSTATATYKVSPVILPSNFATYESIMYRVDDEIHGQNETITAIPSQGANVANTLVVMNSGKGYISGEEVKAYLYGSISNNISILNSGVGYSNNDEILFSGDFTGTAANGYITTDSNGAIINTTLVFAGSGYFNLPTVRIRSNTGTDAVLSATLADYNSATEVIGTVNKTGIGVARGYWTTTKGFISSDKYLQDSYYYQDYSYEIRVAQQLTKYRDIIYDTFHVAGTELFGKYLLIDKNTSYLEILYDDESANTTQSIFMTSDSEILTSDSSVTVDSSIA
jgi:hypothetical protein